MYKFNIAFYNQKEDSWVTKTVSKLTFAEAARSAYMLRSNMGFDWEIRSVSSLEKTNVEIK